MGTPRSKSRGKSSRTKKSAPARKSASLARQSNAHVATTLETKPSPMTNGVTQQAIAEAAYFLWQQRGGNEVVNWLEAESMLRQNLARRF